MPMLCRWGNSLGLRIPRYVADCAHLKPGDVLKVRLLDSGEILVSPAIPRSVTVGQADSATENCAPPLSAEEVLEQW